MLTPGSPSNTARRRGTIEQKNIYKNMHVLEVNSGPTNQTAGHREGERCLCMPHSLRLLRSISMGSVRRAAAAAAAIAADGSADSLECLMCVLGDLGDALREERTPTSPGRLPAPRMDVPIEMGPLPLAGVTD